MPPLSSKSPADDHGVLESPEEVLTTMTRDGKRRWIFPTPSRGRFFWQRLVVGWGLVALFVLLPVVRIGGKPAVLLDIMQREFTLFGVTFYPTDTFLLLLAGMSVVLSVIVLTALLGRVWCGWGCPQTVYLEFVYRPIERLIEGKEHVRRRRREGPWTFDRLWRAAAKWGIYAVLSVALANVFVSYFVGWDRLIAWMTNPPAEQWGFFVLMAFTSGLILFDFGYFREQMCTIACPYARMQSVLLDRDSMIVSYDPGRGEPRARRSKRVMAQEAGGTLKAKGDCVDCFACVRTCPTGIDIREGLQMECVACTQCIDACDVIMDRIDRPRGLIRYTSERSLEGGGTHIWRPRTAIYVLLLVAGALSLVAGISLRDDYDLNIARAAGEPFAVLPDGRVANRLRFRVRNQTGARTTVGLSVAEPNGAAAQVIGVHPVSLDPGQMKRFEAWITFDRDVVRDGLAEGRFVLSFLEGRTDTLDFRLLGPTYSPAAANPPEEVPIEE